MENIFEGSTGLYSPLHTGIIVEKTAWQKQAKLEDVQDRMKFIVQILNLKKKKYLTFDK